MKKYIQNYEYVFLVVLIFLLAFKFSSSFANFCTSNSECGRDEYCNLKTGTCETFFRERKEGKYKPNTKLLVAPSPSAPCKCKLGEYEYDIGDELCDPPSDLGYRVCTYSIAWGCYWALKLCPLHTRCVSISGNPYRIECESTTPPTPTPTSTPSPSPSPCSECTDPTGDIGEKICSFDFDGDIWTILECNGDTCSWKLIEECLHDQSCTYDSNGNPYCVIKPKPSPSLGCQLPSGTTDCDKGWCEPIKDTNGNVIQVLSCFSYEGSEGCYCGALCGSITNSDYCIEYGWCPYGLSCHQSSSTSTESSPGTACTCSK